MLIADHIAFRLPRTAPRLTLLPLHAGLSTNEQLRIFEPAERGYRKVIVSTNIAEVSLENGTIELHIKIIVQASVTIDGVKFVIDSGFVKVDPSYPFLSYLVDIREPTAENV